MIGKSTIRFVRRGFAASMMWAMIPLAAFAGLPTASCACLKCDCGAACKLTSHSAMNPVAGEQAGCSACCCANCPCAGTSHCCCLAKLAAAKKQTCQHLPGQGFNSSESNGCRTSITAVAGIRATTVGIADDVPAAVAGCCRSCSFQPIELVAGSGRPIEHRPAARPCRHSATAGYLISLKRSFALAPCANRRDTIRRRQMPVIAGKALAR